MKATVTLLMIFAVVFSHAQTRRISHRFHSGDDVERYDNKYGNYGGTYPMIRPSVYESIKVKPVNNSSVRLVDVSFVTSDTTNLQQSREQRTMNDVREYGKICSSYSRK